MSGHDSLPVAPDLAGEPPPTTQLCPDSASGAWPTTHSRSQVLHPARSRPPGTFCRPWQHFRRCPGPMQSWPPKTPPGARNAAKSPTKDHVRPYLAEDSRRTRSGMPAHRPDVLRWRPRGLADGARPLPGAASRQLPPSGPLTVGTGVENYY